MPELAQPLPQNLDAERSVLGAILLDNNALSGIGEVLRPEDFFLEQHRRLYGGMIALGKRQRAIDLVTLAEELECAGELEAAGGPAYLAQLIDGVPRVSHVDHYAHIVNEKARERRILKAAEAVLRKGVTPEAVREIMAACATEAISTDGSALRSGPVLRRMAEIEPERLHWLWLNRIPLGKLCLLVGDPGLGKSLLSVDTAARVTQGRMFPDGSPCEAGGVIFLSAEDDPADTIRPRLDAAGADVTRVHLLEAVRVTLRDGSLVESSFNLGRDIEALREAVQRVGGIRLVVIDPISSYLSGIDGNRNSEVRGLLGPLAKFAADCRVAVLCITHLRKSAGAPLLRIVESIAFAAAARAALAVAPDPEDPQQRLLLPLKQNLAPEVAGLAYRIAGPVGSPFLVWESASVSVRPDAVLSGFESGEDRSARIEAEQWLRDFLSDGPIGAREVIRAAADSGVSKTSLWRAASSIGVSKRKLGGRGSGWEWSLADSKIPAPQCGNLDSLDSLHNRLKTETGTAASNSKIPKNSSVNCSDSLEF